MTSPRPFAVILSVLLPLAFLVAGCSDDDTVECDASTCSGCCQADGTCAAGTETSACGVGGAACDTCGGAQRCQAGACVASCRDACNEGEARCEAGRRSVCERGANGCLAFTAAQACPGTQVCSDGACVDACTDQCTAGAQRCATNQRQETCQTASSGCLDWVGQDCAAGEACGTTRCEAPPTCTPECPAGLTCNASRVCELSEVVLDSRLATVSGHLTVNGAVPTYDTDFCTRSPGANLAMVTLKEKDSHAEFSADVPCGSSDFRFSARVPHGTYDVYVKPMEQDGAAVQLSPFWVRVKVGVVVNADVADLQVDEVAHAVSGKVTFNGSVPTLADPAFCASNPTAKLVDVIFRRPAVYELENPEATVSIDCAHRGEFDFETLLPPGDFRVLVRPHHPASPAGPRILPGRLLMPDPLTVSGPVSNLVYDEVGYPVSGRITVNGVTPTLRSGTCSSSRIVAKLNFRNTAGYTGTLDVPCTPDFSFSLLVPPGTLSLDVMDGGDQNVPVTHLPAVGLSKSITASGPLTDVVLDEVAYPVSGRVTVNGAAPQLKRPCTLMDRVGVIFSREGGGYGWTFFSCGDDFRFSTALPAGTYQVRLEPFYSLAAHLVESSYVFPDPLIVSGAMSDVVLDQVAYPLSGRLTVNGATPTGHETYCGQTGNERAELMRLWFYATGAGQASFHTKLTCSEPDFTFSTLVPAGTYDVYTARRAPGNASEGFFPRLTLSAPTTGLRYDRTARLVSGKLTVNDLPPTVDATYCANPSNQDSVLATLQFRASDMALEQRGYTAYVRCRDPNFGFSVWLPPGRYNVSVQQGTAGAGLNFADGPALVPKVLQVP
ncbi:hypothetical protein LY474_22305 [Myxococcus stipitatus]|uniref:hypothetical protein n=1 Tax=Myxococcus stipitatus TaxID=83455 RepID=UPI001F44C362|nr:hypothetical protein [Myxococcus stipitatus]MCE9670541.1 hypothetical protein [Myxococcus stipitatus]